MEEERIVMQKGTVKTSVLLIHKAKYLKSGWKEVKADTQEPKDNLAKVIVDNTDPKTVANARDKVPADNAVTQANALVATELKQESATQELDFLKTNKNKNK